MFPSGGPLLGFPCGGPQPLFRGTFGGGGGAPSGRGALGAGDGGTRSDGDGADPLAGEGWGGRGWGGTFVLMIVVWERGNHLFLA